MAKLQLPFELQKPDASTFVTQTTEIGHNGKSVSDELNTLSEKTVDIDEQKHMLIYKGVKYLIIGIDDDSSQSNLVAIMGNAIMGTTTTMGAK